MYLGLFSRECSARFKECLIRSVGWCSTILRTNARRISRSRGVGGRGGAEVPSRGTCLSFCPREGVGSLYGRMFLLGGLCVWSDGTSGGGALSGGGGFFIQGGLCRETPGIRKGGGTHPTRILVSIIFLE